MEVAITAAGLAIAVYVTVSLLTPREAFDLDRMLHRGEYARDADVGEAGPVLNYARPSLRDRFRVRNILQFDANFTFSDKLVSGGIFWWAMFLLVVNVVVSGWNRCSTTGRSVGGRSTGSSPPSACRSSSRWRP